jgi:NAD(P)-dependent dehydrogenase (short-subunit alcohol dehydrogenase family)
MTTLIIGANSEIAKGIAINVNQTNERLIIISRNIEFYNDPVFKDITIIETSSYHESHIKSAVEELNVDALSRVFICHGLLHDDASYPEKKLSEFDPTSFLNILNANTLTPLLWLKHLTTQMNHKNECKFVFLSARVGSITDNKLGGWYSYRSSKAALNMLLKSAAIELKRTVKNVKLIAFHPGTTDSPLSKPFQKNVPKGKLFTRDFVASALIDITNKAQLDGELSFVDWQGETIDW